MKNLIAFVLLSYVVCDRNRYLAQYGMHFDEGTEIVFHRFEHFEYEELAINTDTDECEAARTRCYDYLKCNYKCGRFVSKWRDDLGQDDPEQSAINPCEQMEHICYGLTNYHINNYLNDDFYGF